MPPDIQDALSGDVVTTTLRIGQRVWVVADQSRTYGHIASLLLAFDDSVGFIARLEGRPDVAACLERRQGIEWDYAPDSAPVGLPDALEEAAK